MQPVIVTEPAKVKHVSTKVTIFISLVYNLLPVTNKTNSLLLLQILMGFLLQLPKHDTTLRTEDISKIITWCNLHSHGCFCAGSVTIYNLRYVPSN